MQSEPEDLVLVPALLGLSMNPYDDIRAGAVGLLKHKSIAILSATVHGEDDLLTIITASIESSQQMLLDSSRADFADGYGRLQELRYELSSEPFRHLQELLSRLSSGLAIARSSLNMAVATAPIHGELIALR